MNEMTPPRGLRLSRRSFLIGAAGTGFVMAFARAAVFLPEQAQQVVAEGGYDPDLWFHLGPDGTVTVHVIRAEMGQHVGTALARILADELEADWAKVQVEHVDSDPKWGTDGHRRQLVGVAELSAAQPGRRGRAHHPDRGGVQAAATCPSRS